VTAAPLEIRVLGELEIVREGRALPLPASKKTRALLGYLVIVGGGPQPRQRLCELFWGDGPDDPRAALRWSLTKLRPLVDDARSMRLVADRERVGFEPCGAALDLAQIRDEVESVATLPVDGMKRVAALFRGEVLEGLDLPECYRYHEWCVAERETARRLRGGILAALAERLADQPEEALGYARAHVTVDPLNEAGHIAVMQLLAKLGRPREALKQYDSCRRILEAQLGREPSRELEAARSVLGRVSTNAPARAVAETFVRDPAQAPLVGRSAERAILAAAVRDATEGACARVLFLVGEPGIGKSRLLADLGDQTVASGGMALFGRAFEAEMVRPYGAWIDALRSAPLNTIDPSLRSDLAALLPELGVAHPGTDRNRLFEAVRKLLLSYTSRAPLVVTLDDLQWFDDASVALLHYTARSLIGSRVLLACAARAGEVDGNPPVQALTRALTREDRLARIDLAPLDAEATAALVRTIDTHVDTGQVFADSGGNPLFSLELARALAQAAGSSTSHTLDGLIAERLSRLDERAAELLPWAAALGRPFSIDTVSTLTSLPARDLLAAVEQLERYGLLRVASSPALGSVGYDFAHDLVRRGAYRALSEPRRRWMHLQIARNLNGATDPAGVLAGDIAHHAALGGDSELAVRAYVAAGERCLRVFAHADASKLATSGMQHVAHLPPEAGIRARLALLAVQVHSNQWLRRSHELESELSRVALAAQARGMHAENARSYYLMSFVHNERGDFTRAGARSLQAAEAGRSADLETRQHQLANTARCLVMMERDVARAEEFMTEAQALGQNASERTLFEMMLAMGFFHAFKGEDEQATTILERAAELAPIHVGHWEQTQALTRLARMALDRGRPREVLERCAALEPLVAKLSEGSEGPFVAALRALARLVMGESDARTAVDAALATLRAIDSKAHLAYALNALAEHDARAHRAADARKHAEEALVAAEAVGHKSEAAVARSLLARLAFDRGDYREALAALSAPEVRRTAPLALSARALAAVAAAAERIGANVARDE
jgi:predicted ATPase/DNA-binding SARP family transcriptional activator